MPIKQKLLLGFEAGLVFIGLPFLLNSFASRWQLFAALWVMALPAFLYFKHQRITWAQLWHGAGDAVGMWLKRASILCAITLCVLISSVFVLTPEKFLSFPRERPALWLMVMVFYPFVSAWPQELIFRSFFFRRYEPLFGQGRGMVFASSIAFAMAHIFYQNWVAFMYSFAGSLVFASGYALHKSLWRVTAEHALYGSLVFTLGLGWYFYLGAWR